MLPRQWQDEILLVNWLSGITQRWLIIIGSLELLIIHILMLSNHWHILYSGFLRCLLFRCLVRLVCLQACSHVSFGFACALVRVGVQQGTHGEDGAHVVLLEGFLGWLVVDRYHAAPDAWEPTEVLVFAAMLLDNTARVRAYVHVDEIPIHFSDRIVFVSNLARKFLSYFDSGLRRLSSRCPSSIMLNS